MSPSPQQVLARSILFLRRIANLLEAGAFAESPNDPAVTDPVGILVMTNNGPAIYVPEEYVLATEAQLKTRGYRVLGYGDDLDPYRMRRVSS